MRDRLEEASNPERRIKVVRGSTFENRSLSDEYIEGFKASYGDSDLAKQELMGEMLDDAEGIVFTDEIIKKALDYDGYMPALHKIIAVDPSVADDPSKNKTDECGIMVMGVTKESDFRKRKVYLIDDISIQASPEQWSKHIVEKAREHGIVDIVAEQNQGYGLIKAVLNAEDSNLRVHLVHAKRNKITRAEPVVVAMDNGRVKMIEEFPTLTDQLLYYDPNMKKSPDRMDALVWGVTALIIDPPPTMRMGTLHIARTPNLSIPQRLDRQAGLLIPRNIRY
jgi:phage terminase large subunit-like protein